MVRKNEKGIQRKTEMKKTKDKKGGNAYQERRNSKKRNMKKTKKKKEKKRKGTSEIKSGNEKRKINKTQRNTTETTIYTKTPHCKKHHSHPKLYNAFILQLVKRSKRLHGERGEARTPGRTTHRRKPEFTLLSIKPFCRPLPATKHDISFA